MTTDSAHAPLALRPRDAARLLGISPRTLWEWTRAGIVPCVRVGTGKRRTVLYPVADLQTWLSRQADAAKPGTVRPDDRAGVRA
jgi:excisionase family DNA binding protein